MTKQLRVLLVDDDRDEYLLAQDLVSERFFSSGGKTPQKIRLDWVETYAEALAAFDKNEHDVYLIDYQLGDRNGLQLLREGLKRGCTAPMILMTGQGNYELDLEAMKAGATDYLVKGEVTAPLLERTIRYALERKRAEEAIREKAEENARLYAAEAQRARELDALHRATAALLSTIDMETLLSQILDAAQSAIPQAEKGMLHLVAPETGQLQIRATSGIRDPRIRAISLPRSTDYAAKAVRQRRPILVSDTWLEFPDLGEGSHAEGPPVRSLVIAPLVLGTEVLGAISLTSSQPGAFNESELRLLVSFATTTTAAIQNALLHAEVQKLALTDGLTGLYNRRGLFEVGQRELERAIRFGRPISAILIDVDHLKDINDSYGHMAGDHVLRIISDRFRASVREVDILGRYGGDEFAIVLPETDLFTACMVAERVRTRISESVHLPSLTEERVTVTLTASLGVANAVTSTSDLEALLERADNAAYRAKKSGRNRVEVA
jgi:diguanylate cyclase (GGDEF)-like protein